METKELNKIKKLYGENFAHLCRQLFPTILEQEGLLTDILTHFIAPTTSLYDDLVEQEQVSAFKREVFKKANIQSKIVDINETPEQLMDKAGYILYPECQTQEEILSYQKYYYKEEALCSFKCHRLKDHRVWFAVKKNVDEIKREDFTTPRRQDEYGTSVISIQFTKGEGSTVSIKNRYNHSVENPDATFSNDLDNIIAGLTSSFCKYYKINMDFEKIKFELRDYDVSADGVWYRVNVKTRYTNNNTYAFCENNVLLSDNVVIKFDKNDQLLVDNYLFDFKKKTITDIVNKKSSIIGVPNDIKMMSITPFSKELRVIIVELENKQDSIRIFVNKHNQMVAYENLYIEEADDDFLHFPKYIRAIRTPKLKSVKDNFLAYTTELKSIVLPNLESAGNDFLAGTAQLDSIVLPKLKTLGDYAFHFAGKLKTFNVPSLVKVGDSCLEFAYDLEEVNAPNLEEVGNNFANDSQVVSKIYMPSLKNVGDSFFNHNTWADKIDFPNLKVIGDRFFSINEIVDSVYLPKVERIGDYFLCKNTDVKHIDMPYLLSVGKNFAERMQIESIDFPSLTIVGDDFMADNTQAKNVNAPCLKEVGGRFLYSNNQITSINFPKLENIANDFLYSNTKISSAVLDKAKYIGSRFLFNNQNLKSLSLKSAETIGNNFMCENEVLSKFDAKKLTEVGYNFLFGNKQLKSLVLPRLSYVCKNFLVKNLVLEKFIAPRLYDIEDTQTFLPHCFTLQVLYTPNFTNYKDEYLDKTAQQTLEEHQSLEF